MNRFMLCLFLILLLSVPSLPQSELVMDSLFFKKFNSLQAISKDDYLEGFINGIVIGRGKIISITESDRYRKKFKVVIESSDSVKYNHKVIYYLFLENPDAIEVLTVGSDFEFKGQFMNYTPLNSKRTWYIIDVVLMDASTLIK